MKMNVTIAHYRYTFNAAWFKLLNIQYFLARFNVMKKCMNKFDCLVNEILCIQELKPALNVQSDSLRAKVFM